MPLAWSGLWVNCLRFARPAEARPEARGQRPEARGQPETKIQMRSNRVWVFWFVSLRLDFCRCVCGLFGFLGFKLCRGWMRRVISMLGRFSTKAKLISCCQQCALYLLLICTPPKVCCCARHHRSMPSLRLERVDGAKAKQCHAHNVRLDRKL